MADSKIHNTTPQHERGKPRLLSPKGAQENGEALARAIAAARAAPQLPDRPPAPASKKAHRDGLAPPRMTAPKITRALAGLPRTRRAAAPTPTRSPAPSPPPPQRGWERLAAFLDALCLKPRGQKQRLRGRQKEILLRIRSMADEETGVLPYSSRRQLAEDVAMPEPSLRRLLETAEKIEWTDEAGERFSLLSQELRETDADSDEPVPRKTDAPGFIIRFLLPHRVPCAPATHDPYNRLTHY